MIGAGGIAFTVVLCAVFFYVGFVQRGGFFDETRVKAAESTLTSLVQAIEFYKIQTGRYPGSLEELRKTFPQNFLVSVFDPTDVRMSGKLRYFHYELVDNDHYYLLGVGPDGQPFTDDDILPKVETGPGSKIGLLMKHGSKGGL